MVKLRTLHYWFLRIARQRATHHEIAFGAALGTFISVFPTFGAGPLLVLLLFKFWKFNLFAALGGSLVSNVFTSPLFLALSYEIGSAFFPAVSVVDLRQWYVHFDDLALSVISGNLLLSFFLSVLVYGLLRVVVPQWRSRMKVKTHETPDP